MKFVHGLEDVDGRAAKPVQGHDRHGVAFAGVVEERL
jgi:hypothetical protein